MGWCWGCWGGGFGWGVVGWEGVVGWGEALVVLYVVGAISGFAVV